MAVFLQSVNEDGSGNLGGDSWGAAGSVCVEAPGRQFSTAVTRLRSLLLVVGLLGAGTGAAVLRESARPTAASATARLEVAPVGTSAAELALIAEAQSALSEGNPAKARSLLRQHSERFPDGRLKVQRKLLEAYTERVEKGAP